MCEAIVSTVPLISRLRESIDNEFGEMWYCECGLMNNGDEETCIVSGCSGSREAARARQEEVCSRVYLTRLENPNLLDV